MTPELVQCAEAAWDRKAKEFVILELRGLSDVTDHFVICHGTSGRQVLAIADSIEEHLRTVGVRPNHVEGRANAEWILMDYIDFVVHVFLEERREFYRLERLWGDAKRVTPPAPEQLARSSSPQGG